MTPSKSRMRFLLSVLVFIFSGILSVAFAAATGTDNKAIHPVPGAPAKNPDSKTPAQENPINVIARDLKDGSVLDDAVEKIYAFMWKDYVGAAFKNAPDNQGRLRAAVKEWAAKEIVGDSTRRELAQLYFVLADDARTKVLSTNMEPWTGKPAAAKDNPRTFAQGQLQETNFAQWTLGFLTEAEIHAHKNLTDSRPLAEVKKNVVQNEDKPTVAAEMPKPAPQNPLPPEQPGYAKLPNWEYLYAQGGKARLIGPLNSQLKGDKDPDAFSREISLKIASVKDENGKIINELRIYDYTDKGDIFHQSFPLTAQKGVFQLDDRKASGVKRKYELTIEAKEGGELAITFCMPKNCEKPKDENTEMPGQIRTTLSFLNRARLDQAASVGVPKTINGQDYFVLDQGGQFGGKLFFPGGIRSDRTKNFTPEIAVEVSEWDYKLKKNIINTEGKIDIGMVGDKRFHLKYVKEPPPPGFDVFPGAGDPPKPKPQEPKKPDPANPGPKPTPTDPPVGSEPGDGRNDPDGKYGKACVPTEDEKENLKFYKQGDWSFFVQPIKEKKTSSQLCFNDSQRIFVQGLFVEGGVKIEEINGAKNLILDVVSGNSFVNPDSLKNGQVPEASIPGGGEQTTYPSRDIYYINPGQLQPKNIERVIKLNEGNYPTPDKLARVQAIYNVSRKKAVVLFVYQGSSEDPKKAADSVDNALKDFGPGSSLYEMYQKPANKEKIQSYVLAEAEKYKGKDLSLTAHFTVSLYWGEEKKEIKEPVDAIYPTYVEGVASDRLVYCPKGGMHFETTAEHRAGTLHPRRSPEMESDLQSILRIK